MGGTFSCFPQALAAEASPSSPTARNANHKSELKAAYDRAFQAMIHDITNLDKTFAFAELAVQVGDYEGAISAFERMLLIDPNLPHVKLELGALYFRLGSYRMAQSYLTDALASANVPAHVQTRIRKLLAEVKERLSPNHFFGSLAVGARFQSNANAGPSNQLVEVGGSLAVLNSRFTSKRDWNAFVLGQATDIYDFETQSGTTLETNAILYGADQETQKQVNVGFVELNSGPRFKLFPNQITNATIKPYAIADLVAVGHARDYWAGGVGLDLTKAVTARVGLDLTTELRHRSFHNSSLFPVNSQQNGIQSYNRFLLEEKITPSLSALEIFAFTDTGAALKSYANLEYAGTVGLSYQYVLPGFGRSDLPLTSSVTVMRAFTPYAAPDPTINPDVSRADHDWQADFVTTIPLTHSLTVVASAGIFRRDSTLPNYRFRNEYGGVGLNWRF